MLSFKKFIQQKDYCSRRILEASDFVLDGAKIRKSIENIKERPFNELFGNKDRFLVKAFNPVFLQYMELFDLNQNNFDLKKGVYIENGKRMRYGNIIKDRTQKNVSITPKEVRQLKHLLKQKQIYAHLLFSRHPMDVIRMSDINKISSCHSPYGSKFDCAITESQNNGGIVFIINERDKKNVEKNLDIEDLFEDRDRNIKGFVTPLARVRLRRFVDVLEECDFAVPEKRYYVPDGDMMGYSGFYSNIVLDYCRKNQKIFKDSPSDKYISENIFHTGGDYTDTPYLELLNNFFDRDTVQGLGGSYGSFAEIPFERLPFAKEKYLLLRNSKNILKELKPYIGKDYTALFSLMKFSINIGEYLDAVFLEKVIPLYIKQCIAKNRQPCISGHRGLFIFLKIYNLLIETNSTSSSSELLANIIIKYLSTPSYLYGPPFVMDFYTNGQDFWFQNMRIPSDYNDFIVNMKKFIANNKEKIINLINNTQIPLFNIIYFYRTLRVSVGDYDGLTHSNIKNESIKFILSETKQKFISLTVKSICLHLVWANFHLDNLFYDNKNIGENDMIYFYSPSDDAVINFSDLDKKEKLSNILFPTLLDTLNQIIYSKYTHLNLDYYLNRFILLCRIVFKDNKIIYNNIIDYFVNDIIPGSVELKQTTTIITRENIYGIIRLFLLHSLLSESQIKKIKSKLIECDINYIKHSMHDSFKHSLNGCLFEYYLKDLYFYSFFVKYLNNNRHNDYFIPFSLNEEEIKTYEDLIMLWIFDRDLNQEGQSIRRLYDDGSRTFSYVNIQVVSNNNNIEEGIPIPYKDKTVIMTCNNDYDVKGVDSQFDRIHTVFHNIHTTNPKIFSDEILFFQSLNVS
jgi:hypothetical protein